MLYHLFGGITTLIMLKLFSFGKVIIALVDFCFLKVNIKNIYSPVNWQKLSGLAPLFPLNGCSKIC